MGEGKTAVDFGFLRIFRRKEIVEIFFRFDHVGVFFTKLLRALKKVLLNGSQNFRYNGDEFLSRHGLFSFNRLIAAANNQRVFLQVAWSNFDPDWNTFLDPFPIFNTATNVTPVYLHLERKFAKGLSAQLQREIIARLHDSGTRLLLCCHWQYYNLGRRDPWRQNDPVVVSVHHDQRADQTRGHSPARCPAKFLLAFPVLKLDATRARKILAEKMRCARLDGASVLHHRFDC